jgi:hypothetical protein
MAVNVASNADDFQLAFFCHMIKGLSAESEPTVLSPRCLPFIGTLEIQFRKFSG